MLAITINNQVIDTYLASYDVTVKKVYDENLNATAVSGKKIQKLLGVQRELKVKFEPMSTAQVSQLFTAIGLSQLGSTITYIDPMLGTSATKIFTCEQLPAASYFESDDGIDLWTIPDITFTEVVDTSSWGSL
jgi:hypothetical protein